MKLLTNSIKYAIIQIYGKGIRQQNKTIWHKGQAFLWRNKLRASQSRSRANYCRNQQKGGRAWQEIWHETPAGVFSIYNALINQNKGVIWEG